jgi:putative ABC transport system permease protein
VTSSLSLFLTVRNIRRRPLRALLTTMGIVLGVAMVVAVLSLSATLFDGFSGLYDTVYGKTDLIVSRDVGGGNLTPFDESVVQRVKETPGVDAAQTTGEVSDTLFLVDERGEVKEGASDRLSFGGFEAGKLSGISSYTLVSGRELTRPGDFVAEDGWAKDKGLGVGSTIRVAAPAGVRTLRITGTFRFSRPVSFGGTGFAAASLPLAQSLLDLEGRVTQINVRSQDRTRIQQLRARLQRELGDAFAVRTPSGEVDELAKQLSGLNTFLLFFAGVALFVGAFLIFNAFNITVLQRTREIGMMRTLGGTRRAVLRQVLAEAAWMGLMGSLLGLAAGVGLAIGLVALVGSIFVGIPFGSLTVPASALVTGAVVGTVVSALAALYPAVRASRISPLAAMRRRAETVGRVPWRAAVAGLVVIAASAPGVWLLTRTDASTAETFYGIAGIIGVFLGVSLAAPLIVRPLVRLLGAPLQALGQVEGRLATDNASRAPARTGLTACAVMIGLALVITFGCFSASAIGAVRDSIDRSVRSDFIVAPREVFTFQGFSPELARRIAALPEVAASSAINFGFTRLDGETTQVIGVDPGGFGAVSGDTLEGGGTPDWSELDGPAAFVTKPLAATRDLAVGDTVTMATTRGRTERLRIAGVLDEPDQHLFISTSRAARDLGITQSYYVYAKAADSAAARAALREALERVAKDYPTAKVLSNEELKNRIEAGFDQIFGFLYALLAVAIVASVLGIVNTLLMSVLERTREIGVIRAIGGTRRQVRRMIRRESVLVTLVGVVLGIVVGLVLGYVFVRASASQFPGLAFTVPWTTIAVVVVGALVVAALAAVLPARRATRLNVIEAVGFE